MSESDTHDAIEAVARDSYGRLVAYIASRTGDIADAQDALSEALAVAIVVVLSAGCAATRPIGDAGLGAGGAYLAWNWVSICVGKLLVVGEKPTVSRSSPVPPGQSLP